METHSSSTAAIPARENIAPTRPRDPDQHKKVSLELKNITDENEVRFIKDEICDTELHNWSNKIVITAAAVN